MLVIGAGFIECLAAQGGCLRLLIWMPSATGLAEVDLVQSMDCVWCRAIFESKIRNAPLRLASPVVVANKIIPHSGSMAVAAHKIISHMPDAPLSPKRW